MPSDNDNILIQMWTQLIKTLQPPSGRMETIFPGNPKIRMVQMGQKCITIDTQLLGEAAKKPLPTSPSDLESLSNNPVASVYIPTDGDKIQSIAFCYLPLYLQDPGLISVNGRYSKKQLAQIFENINSDNSQLTCKHTQPLRVLHGCLSGTALEFHESECHYPKAYKSLHHLHLARTDLTPLRREDVECALDGYQIISTHDGRLLINATERAQVIQNFERHVNPVAFAERLVSQSLYSFAYVFMISFIIQLMKHYIQPDSKCSNAATTAIKLLLNYLPGLLILSFSSFSSTTIVLQIVGTLLNHLGFAGARDFLFITNIARIFATGNISDALAQTMGCHLGEIFGQRSAQLSISVVDSVIRTPPNNKFHLFKNQPTNSDSGDQKRLHPYRTSKS